MAGVRGVHRPAARGEPQGAGSAGADDVWPGSVDDVHAGRVGGDDVRDQAGGGVPGIVYLAN
jgi:hypothetical protein